MKLILTEKEINIVLESLRYTQIKFEDYTQYPSSQFRRERIREIENLSSKIRNQRKKEKEKA